MEGTKVCSGDLGHTPIYGKNSLEIFFSGTKGPLALGLGMQHHGPTKFVQMMTLS